MPHVVCPRCHRANPGDAVFCWFDGVVLRQSAGPTGASPLLPQEFVFPSGRCCRTYDDLLEACQTEWQDAREMLHKGDLGRFLARLGRMDLVRAAKEAQAQGDPDLALQNFLTSLPASQAPGAGPRLDLNPRRLMLGSMHVGEQRQVHVTVSNRGQGVLQGKVRVSEGEEWLKILGVDGERELPLKVTREQELVLRIEPQGLPAGQTYSGKLTVVTNGGVVEAPVRLDLAATPFARPPFQGASTARELAEQMRANPKPAGPLLESGDVARWFAANGWSYPVPGAPARGVAAVQQFFECMGLSKPPPLELSQAEFHFQCEAPQTVSGQVTIHTPARKWVYAQAAGDQPWLRVTTPNVSGPQQTSISFEVDSGLMTDGPVQEGLLQITANAGQRFQVRVRVEVRRPRGYRPPAPPPPAAVPIPVLAPPPIPAPPPVPVAAPPLRALAQPAAPVRPLMQPSSPVQPFPTPMTPHQVAPLPPTIMPGSFQFETTPRSLAPQPRGSHGGRLMQSVLAGAALALLLRGVLLLPADLYARIIVRAIDSSPAAAEQPPTAGWDFWRFGPMTDGIIDPGFLRQFVFATWWIGVIAGPVLIWRGGGRAADVACGVVAGAAAGVGGAASLGCILVLLDGLPRAILQLVNAAVGSSAASTSPWLATPLWCILALGSWIFLGGGAGLILGMLGARGGRILSAVAAPLIWALRACGMKGMASFFALQ